MTGLLGFISTNIDDIFVLTFLFSQVGPKLKKKEIIFGQFLGLGALVLVSLLLSYGFGTFFADKLHYLGFIPIFIGVKAWFDYRKDEEEESLVFESPVTNGKSRSFLTSFFDSAIFRVSLLIFAGGADNIGIYTPLFARLTPFELGLTLLIFGAMVPLWCVIGEKIANYPLVRKQIERYEHLVIPFVFIILGLFILFDLA